MTEISAIACVYSLNRDVAVSVLAAMVAGDPPPVQAYGLEAVEDADQSNVLTSDGREIVRIDGIPYALRPDIHTRRLTEYVAAKQQRAETMRAPLPSSRQTTVCTALIDGQLCGGTLVKASVCPRCALGKSGVSATLTCDVCGHVSAIMCGDA